jgi:hypothetical protein
LIFILLSLNARSDAFAGSVQSTGDQEAHSSH